MKKADYVNYAKSIIYSINKSERKYTANIKSAKNTREKEVSLLELELNELKSKYMSENLLTLNNKQISINDTITFKNNRNFKVDSIYISNNFDCKINLIAEQTGSRKTINELDLRKTVWLSSENKFTSKDANEVFPDCEAWLINEMQKELNLDANDIKLIVGLMLETIKNNVSVGNKVSLNNFGYFVRRTVLKKKCNIQYMKGLTDTYNFTNVKFKPSKDFRNSIKGCQIK